jgi:hypothetical protein
VRVEIVVLFMFKQGGAQLAVRHHLQPLQGQGRACVTQLVTPRAQFVSLMEKKQATRHQMK